MTIQSLQIKLNGDSAHTSAATIADLLAEYDLQTPRVAVIQNNDVVPKGDFATRRLANGDAIDIITIIGGG